MDIITFFRVETAERDGPFRNYRKVETARLVVANTDPIRHPNPYDDFGYSCYPGLPFCMEFGCSSVEMLAQWFDKQIIIDALEADDYIIAEYIIEEEFIETSQSGTQVMFNRCEAVLMTTHPIHKLREYANG